MPAKKFIIPFAATGDKTAVPNTLQPDGTVSYAQGFGPDYELDKTLDPINAKDVPRDQTNQIYFDLTDAVGEQQLYGVALWGADRAPYPLNARVYHNDKLWRSSVINNSGEPGVADWDDVSAQSPDFLNTTRIDVASASTVNLTAAPNTRHINITGTTGITGFTVAAGQCYFVRFNAALTLTNSASLVTQRGTNILTAAGDTCIVRATAANTVEILCYTTNVGAFGVGQTWQAFTTPARAANTSYTNSTGKPIFVSISTLYGVDISSISVDGVTVGFTGGNSSSPYSCAIAAVPHGASYQFNSGSSAYNSWAELR